MLNLTTDEMKNDSTISQMQRSHALPSWAASLEAIAERLSEFLSRHRYAVQLLFLAAYLTTTCYRASRKLFWFDEIFTLYISRLPGLDSIWSALSKGADLNPPLLYELTRVSEILFGQGHVAARLPAILGFGVFCLCLFRFVSIRSSVVGGFISMLFPLVTGAYWYAYEARSHGVILGFGGVALICWQGAAMRSERRLWWLTGLAGALACAMLTHSYAVLLLLPIVFGELARSVTLRRLDWPVWAAMVVASAAILPSFVLLRLALLGYSVLPADNFFIPTVPKLVLSYYSYLAPAADVLFGALVLLLIAQMSRGPTVKQPMHVSKHESHELVVLCVFLLIPVFAYLAAQLTGAPFVSRYGISCIAGFAGLLGIALTRKTLIAIGLLFILATKIGISFTQFIRSTSILEPTVSIALSTYAPHFMRRYAMMARSPDKESPIVLLDDLEFAPTFYYAPAFLASRLTLLVLSKTDVNALGYRNLVKCCNAAGNVADLSDFLSSHDRFLVYGGPRSFWVVKYLITLGAIVAINHLPEDQFVFSVTFPKKDSAIPAAR